MAFIGRGRLGFGEAPAILDVMPRLGYMASISRRGSRGVDAGLCPVSGGSAWERWLPLGLEGITSVRPAGPLVRVGEAGRAWRAREGKGATLGLCAG
jgi:hypothetical protein